MRGAFLVGLAALGGCGQTHDACHEGQRPTAVRTQRDAVLGYRQHMHAHNDYAHEHPLQDALDAGFYSVEADVWLVGKDLRVGHWPWQLQGSLQSVYLDPLQALVDAQGSVHGDGAPFLLWIDIKERNPLYIQTLRDVLGGYSMLSVFDSTHVEQRPVTVVFTGDTFIKTRTVEKDGAVPATRDGDYSLQDKSADTRFSHYALDWKTFLTWDGTGDIDDDSARQLGCIMENARALGRPVRIYNAPDVPAAWDVLLRFGVDLINTDHLQELADHLRQAP